MESTTSYDGLDSLGATDDMFGVGHAREEASYD
jgi:hypothetical protein